MLNIKLLSNRVLIDIDGVETKTKSGVVLPKSFEPSNLTTGIIAAVGPGKEDKDGEFVHPIKVKVGDKVMFQYGNKVQVGGKNYILGTDEDIVMIMEG